MKNLQKSNEFHYLQIRLNHINFNREMVQNQQLEIPNEANWLQIPSILSFLLPVLPFSYFSFFGGWMGDGAQLFCLKNEFYAVQFAGCFHCDFSKKDFELMRTGPGRRTEYHTTPLVPNRLNNAHLIRFALSNLVGAYTQYIWFFNFSGQRLHFQSRPRKR